LKRKKEGASLIVVIIVFMFVTTVSMAMLSMVAGNYKSRVVESKRIENLYASDSGLDVAYNIMAKTFDAATKYGYYKVQALKNLESNGNSPYKDNYNYLERDIEELENEIEGLKNKVPSGDETRTDINNQIKAKNDLITESRSLEQLLLNEEFKRAFKTFIKEPTDKNELGSGEAAPDKLKNSIENYKFVDVSINDNGIQYADKIVNFGIDNAKNVQPKLTLQIGEPTSSGTSETKGISKSDYGHHETVEIKITPEQKYENITVTSDFYTEKFNGNKDTSDKTNQRTVQETFDMIVPNFNEAYYQEVVTEMNEYLATKERALTVHGNMNVTEADNFTVSNGEIFVEGRTPNVGVDSTRSFKKYNGGIMIAKSDKVKFTDNVITRNSFNVRNDANVTIGKNLYGRNVYLGGIYDSDHPDDPDNLGKESSNSNLYVNSVDNTQGQIVIDNDLGLKAQGSHIYIKDFYGINDKNIESTDAYGNPVDRVKSSSSIIVNTSDNSTININNSAYIMGTAHINTNETTGYSNNQYQTGESGAVKGNYIAYTIPLNEAEKFAYYDPLQLLDEPNVFKKSQHFADYWNGEIAKNINHNPDMGGISWPADINNIWSTGAIVCETGGKKSVIGSHYKSDLEDVNGAVYNKQKEFAIKVYRFNQEATKNYDYDYEKLTDFTDLVKTANIASEPSYQLEKQNNKGEYAIFNGDDTKEIKIEMSTDGVEKIDTKTTNDIVIYVTNKGTDLDPKYDLNAVIVTKGKLSIGAGITINGCVIVDGDLNINQQKVTINYDPGVIGRVQAKNSGIFKTVFGGWIIPPDNNNSIDNNGNLASAYDLSHFLEKKLWKIGK
jgi:hypothetical protein